MPNLQFQHNDLNHRIGIHHRRDREAEGQHSEARSNLSAEIRAFNGEIYKVDTNVVQYFLGMTKHKSISFQDWLGGNIAGDVRKWPVSSEDLIKIKMEQKIIFEKMVAERFTGYKESFDNRRANSINDRQMIVKEIEDINNIVTKERYRFRGKPANEVFKIGNYSFRGYSNFQCIQDMYEAAINGSIDFGIVPSERQKIGVAGLSAQVDCMVQAFAFGKMLEYLNSLLKPEAPVKHVFDNILNNSSFGDGTIINVGSGNITDVKINIKKGDFITVRSELEKTGLDADNNI